jgi:hypothetical protein
MSYYQFPYQVLSWKPPDLSPAEQFAFGQRVASVGKRQMRHAFRRALPKEGNEHAAREIAALRKLSLRRRVIRCAIVFVPLLAVFYFVPRSLAAALSIAAFVCLMWYGSIAFATLRYTRFLSRCLAQYETAIRDGYVLLACPQCDQQLRLPYARGRIEATCTACSHRFAYTT